MRAMNSNETPRVPNGPTGAVGPVDSSRIPRYAGPATFARLPRIEEFLCQGMDDATPTTETWQRLRELVTA